MKLATDAVLLMLVLSLPPVLLATILGLLISLLQALTQIQEQNLPFSVKLIGVVIVLLLLSPWMGEQLLAYCDEVYGSLVSLSK